MVEILRYKNELFPGLSSEKKRWIAEGIAVIETTLGDDFACKICCLNTPIGLQAIISSDVIRQLHDFIAKYGSRNVRLPLSYHDRGQISDYFDPNSGWDMADVLIDGLRTKRALYMFLHGIMENDERALAAIERLKRLPQSQQKQIHPIVSTDQFGPCNVPQEEAEEIGRQRSLRALEVLGGFPNLILYVFYAPYYRSKEDELEKVRKRFGPSLLDSIKVETIEVCLPTRRPIPGTTQDFGIDLSHGYAIAVNGTVSFKKFMGPVAGWNNIGNIYDTNSNKVEQVIMGLT